MHFLADHGAPLNVIVPTGNLGNACAALLAKRMGLRIGEIRLATHANDVLPRYLGGADYAPQPTRATLANAINVGAPREWTRVLKGNVCQVRIDIGGWRSYIKK